MKEITVNYGHEFIGNRIRDELLIYDIWDYEITEANIINDIKNYFDFNIEKCRNINTLSGGQRAITFIVTFAWVFKVKNIKAPTIKLNNIIESLTENSSKKLHNYLSERGINAT